MPLVQKFIVEDAEKASSLLPAHVALVNPDGTPYTGPVVAHVDPSTGTAQQIIEALIAAGIMADDIEEASIQTMAAPMADVAPEADADDIEEASIQTMAAPMADVAPEADADDVEESKPTMNNTADEIRTYAEAHGIEVPSNATKAEMLELIG